MRVYFIPIIALALALSGCQRSLQPETTEVRLYQMAPEQNLSPDSLILTMIDPYKAQLDVEMSEVLGYVQTELLKEMPESTLGNWVADLTLQQCQKHYSDPIDFAIVNYGGLRLPQIPVGPITRGKIFELMPFENTMVVMKLNGAVVQQMADRIADYGGWPVSATLRFEIDGGKAKNVLLGGKPLQADRIYRMVVTNFVANGGDRCFFLVDQPRDEINMLFRDLIMDYVIQETEQGRVISARKDGRIVVVKKKLFLQRGLKKSTKVL